MIKRIHALWIVLICLMTAMSCQNTATDSLGSSQRNAQPSPTLDESEFDPLCCSPYASDGLRKAWEDFAQNGRFKVARAHSYEYIWGDLGYEFDGAYKHLVVLVSDSMKSGPDHYAVAIFSSPSGGNGRYKQYWLHAVEAKADTQIGTASGYLFIDGCSVRWSRAKGEYVCG